jgi:hypothetical protein
VKHGQEIKEFRSGRTGVVAGIAISLQFSAMAQKPWNPLPLEECASWPMCSA